MKTKHWWLLYSVFVATLCVLGSHDLAFADIESPFSDMTDKGNEFLDLLKSDFAKMVAGIGLLFVAMRFLGGKMEWQRAIPWAAGCALIVGLEQILDWIWA